MRPWFGGWDTADCSCQRFRVMDSMEAAIAAGVGAHPSATAAKRPQLPNNFFKFPAPARLKAIQHYINSFEYKQTPTTSFNSHKFRPLSRIMDTAKMMIYSPQPIKCVEAVFLALYLTAGMQDVERIPLSFKTQEDDKVHQHIVLLVRYGDKYGAFGISRRTDLMNKEFDYDNISSIVENYKRAYENHMHTVLKIRIGLPVEHNVESYNFICWRYLTIAPCTQHWQQCCDEMDRHVQQGKKLWEKWLIEGQGGAAKTSAFRQCQKKEDDPRARPSSVSAALVTKQVTTAATAKDSRRPGSRSRTFRLARAEASGTGKLQRRATPQQPEWAFVTYLRLDISVRTRRVEGQRMRKQICSLARFVKLVWLKITAINHFSIVLALPLLA
ncbi:vasohibin-1 isoform X1 [Selaginella moellendorffii]|uniref:vasohibin-1 isoform X1 n=1 Tax=Selaginella moellendorffii TaxID=88036 RepID=UPI000D1CEA61|nr:vasohibin-1 isoform X1 [Selaginella moellendorffii]XP_024530084.1 vasohibin-1 isoform X1 [Selaginella moellendorffii]|eukprot:XP_002969550.2 vasohibin-1 isoform X1 [Selaginella moellendorffii]